MHRLWLASVLLLGLALLKGCGDSPGVARGRYRCPECNVVLIIVDTLRADHVGRRYSGKSITPHLDQLAENSLVFENAYSPSSWTRTACASILSSKLPIQHNIQSESPKHVLRKDIFTLQEFFNEISYSTAAFLTNVHYKYGLTRDFGYTYFRNNQDAGRVYDQARHWIAHHTQRKFFVLIHNNDPHDSYIFHQGFGTNPISRYRNLDPFFPLLQAPPGLDCDHPGRIVKLNPEQLAEMKYNYDGEIAYVDYHLGRFLGALEQLELKRKTIVVFTADHGEEFLDHGSYWHGCTLFNELLHVPLTVHLPGLEGREFQQRVSTVDIFPTLMEVLDPDRPESSQLVGQSLIPLVTDRRWVEKPVFSSTGFRGQLKYSYISGRHKIIRRATGEVIGVYDLSQDPLEQANLEGEPELVETLNRALQSLVDSRQEAEREPDSEIVIDEETREHLRSLGYAD